MICSNFSTGFDFDAVTHFNRVIADGGIITNSQFLSDFIRDLKNGPENCYSFLKGLWIPCAIKKDASNKVSKIYDLSPAKENIYYDAIQDTEASQQQWVDNYLDGKPAILFDSSLDGYTATNITEINAPGYVMAICRKNDAGSTTRAIFDSATNQWELVYRNNTTQIVVSTNTQARIITTDQTTFAQFTCFFGNSGDGGGKIRRKGIELFGGDLGANSLSGDITIGKTSSGSVHNGPIMLILLAKLNSITQRNYIESLLNNKYYPSTVP